LNFLGQQEQRKQMRYGAHIWISNEEAIPQQDEERLQRKGFKRRFCSAQANHEQ
jgi:hypothetical protein